MDVCDNYNQVNQKFSAQFGPKEPPQTVRNQLKVVKQKAEEPLEEFAERCQSLAYDAWGDDNLDMVNRAAVDAFLHGVMDTKSAYSAMDKNPANTDEALDYVKCVMHNCKALFGACTKTIQNVTFTGDEGVERHIRIVKQVTPAPLAKAGDRIEKLEKSVADTNSQLDKILKLLEQAPPQSPLCSSPRQRTQPQCHRCKEVGHFIRDCTAETGSRSPSPTPGNRNVSPATDKLVNAQGLGKMAIAQLQIVTQANHHHTHCYSHHHYCHQFHHHHRKHHHHHHHRYLHPRS